LAIEIFARDHDDAAIPKVQRRRKNAAVPERENRTTPGAIDCIEVLAPVLAPRVGAAQRLDHGRAQRRDRGGLEVLTARERHRPSYWGPSPPSGGTQSMIWYGSMMSHVLQCTQFDALMCSFFPPWPSSTISYTLAGQKRVHGLPYSIRHLVRQMSVSCTIR